MMIGIIGAMAVEIEEIKKQIVDLVIEEKGIRTFYKGKIHHQEVVVVLAGIGKVNAAITTSLLIEQYPITTIVNIGVAGGQNGVSHKDVVVSTEVLYHDVDVTSFGTYISGQLPGHKPTFLASQDLIDKTISVLKKNQVSYRVGKIATGDQFVTSKQTIQAVNQIYTDIYAVEMEAAAIAQTATIYNIPFVILRSISDLLDDKTQTNDFNTFVQEASETASLVLKELITIL